MSAKLAGLGMGALLLLYLIFIVQYAFVLIGVGEPVAVAMGIALLVLPLLGAWALAAELVFAFKAERLMKTLRTEGPLPADDLPRLASGRPDPAEADKVFPVYKEAVEAEPESWRAWLRLALAYDASGDRARARWATRQAFKAERTTRRG